MKEVHSRAWYVGKGVGFRTCKRGIGGTWEKNECGSIEVREIKYGRGKEL